MNILRSRAEQNLGRVIFGLLFLGCLLILLPFVTALLWAVVLSFSVRPLYERVLKWTGGRAALAASIICLAMVLALVVPLGIVGFNLSDNVTELKTAAKRALESGLPPAPAWVGKIPLVGRSATESWNSVAGDKAKLAVKAKELIEPVAAWLVKAGMKLGIGVAQLALSILLTFFLLRNGPALGERLKELVNRVIGERGTELLELAGKTVRGVVYGIIGTAVVQAVMAGIGFLIAGVPAAGLLAFLVFFLSVVPMGPPLVLIPAALWLFHQGSSGWGVFMLIWGLLVSTIDNFVKPFLISQGSDMPFILIMFGVLGGALAFGFIGVFIGPTLLALGYRLVQEWSTSAETTEKDLQQLNPRAESIPHESIAKM